MLADLFQSRKFGKCNSFLLAECCSAITRCVGINTSCSGRTAPAGWRGPCNILYKEMDIFCHMPDSDQAGLADPDLA